MAESVSRDIIYSLLETNQVEQLVRAAIQHGGVATTDGDVLRALMQTALTVGDLETVRATASHLVAVGISQGNFMLSLEGICLLRNVGGDATPKIEEVLDALESRGFSSEQTLAYPDWSPSLEELDANENEPPPATVLELLREEPLKPSIEPFGWVSLWPALDREVRQAVIERLHFEMRQPTEPALQPPRIVAAWVISGEVTVNNHAYTLPSGTMFTHTPQSEAVQGGRHLRMVGLRHEHWEELLALPGFLSEWEHSQLRISVHDAVEKIATTYKLDNSAIEGLLSKATISHPGSSAGSDAQNRILLIIDGQLSLPIRQERRVVSTALGPGTLVALPSGISIGRLDARVLRWSESAFLQYCPLEIGSLLEIGIEDAAGEQAKA